MRLADRFKCTRRELHERMNAAEFAEWIGFLIFERKYQDLHTKKK